MMPDSSVQMCPRVGAGGALSVAVLCGVHEEGAICYM